MISKKNTLTIFIFYLMLMSCREELTYLERYDQELAQEKSTLSTKTEAEKYQYLTRHLEVVRDGFLALSSDQNFKEALYTEVEKQFDTDYNALVSTLSEKYKNLLLVASRSPYIHDGSFSTSLSAFLDISDDGEKINLRPQIYIPNYEKLKEQALLSKTPTLVCFNGDESVSSWSGVKLVNGKPEIVTVDELYVSENETWILSFNETHTSLQPEVIEANRLASKGGEAGRSQIINCVSFGQSACDFYNSAWSPRWEHLNIFRYSIDCLKENFLSGKADVAIVSFLAFTNFINPTNGLHEDPDWVGDSDHRSMFKVSSAQLGQCTQNNYMLIQNWYPFYLPNESGRGVGDIFYYIIYEHDNWPASLDQIAITPFFASNTRLFLTFRSSQTEYGYGSFSGEEKCLVCAPGHGSTMCDNRIDGGCGEFHFWMNP